MLLRVLEGGWRHAREALEVFGEERRIGKPSKTENGVIMLCMTPFFVKLYIF